MSTDFHVAEILGNGQTWSDLHFSSRPHRVHIGVSHVLGEHHFLYVPTREIYFYIIGIYSFVDYLLDLNAMYFFGLSGIVQYWT